MNTINDLVNAIFTQNDADFYNNREFDNVLNRPYKEKFEEVIAAAIFKRLVNELNELPNYDDTKADIAKRHSSKISKVATNVSTLADFMGSISVLQFGRSLELIADGFIESEKRPDSFYEVDSQNNWTGV